MKFPIQKLKALIQPDNIKKLYSKYEPYWSPVAMAAGFIFDNLTLRRVDLLAENLVIIIYLAAVLGLIFYLTAYEHGRLKKELLIKIARISPYALQFFFGGLFSAFLVFYRRSASITSSWPFLLILASMLIDNELFRQRYQRLTFRLTIYFIAIFSYSVFAVPIIFNELGTKMFLLSGLVSILLLIIIVLLAKKITPQGVSQGKKSLLISVASIYILFNFLYFTNIIPPIPLALKDLMVAHSVKRVAQGYEVKFEPAPWYQFWRQENSVINWKSGAPIYIYSAIFAPTDINAKIFHRWYYRNETIGKWQEKSLLGFEISGGTDRGYRGYSLKYQLQAGRWRVEVVNERGQILGRTKFEIVETSELPNLKTVLK